MINFCRHCNSSLNESVIDLGHQPPSNAYLTKDELNLPETTYPLKVYICTKCWLMQLPEHASSKELFKADYAYFSSTSKSWCAHAKHFVDYAIKKLDLNSKSYVVEIASNDGYLLQYMQGESIPCLGIEPTHATANASILKGINTLEKFFDSELANNLRKADLIIANNVLAHVPNIRDFVKGISILLKSNGQVSIEFPHLLKLLNLNQFDTIYHEHYSYLSLIFVQKLFSEYDLEIIDVNEISTHGGSLRVWIGKKGVFQISNNVQNILTLEKLANLENLDSYLGFQKRAELAKYQLIDFLIQAKKENKKVLGYGAAAKGSTFLNYAGIKSDLLPAIADSAKSKQGLFMPGSHIPIITPEEFYLENCQNVLILSWNLIKEFKEILNGKTLITAIPKLQIWN